MEDQRTLAATHSVAAALQGKFVRPDPEASHRLRDLQGRRESRGEGGEGPATDVGGSLPSSPTLKIPPFHLGSPSRLFVSLLFTCCSVCVLH